GCTAASRRNARRARRLARRRRPQTSRDAPCGPGALPPGCQARRPGGRSLFFEQRLRGLEIGGRDEDLALAAFAAETLERRVVFVGRPVSALDAVRPQQPADDFRLRLARDLRDANDLLHASSLTRGDNRRVEAERPIPIPHGLVVLVGRRAPARAALRPCSRRVQPLRPATTRWRAPPRSRRASGSR